MHYQVLSRRFRPNKFADVINQDAICITLKNAIKQKRIAQAYLFCGSRGTGKTTLARIFAKALNCKHRKDDIEPCNECASCKEISTGNSLDVLEIDGASHRGIDDIRKINETVGYSTSSGGYKIIIIDEVHMLTKEAFNALLKTLEEPPKNVVFFFATTEPHKVLPTIVSRCQKFNLNRIATGKICEKLSNILYELQIEAEPKALEVIAKRAEGGLRDAESLLDQILAFHEGMITEKAVSDALGLMPKEALFQLDAAVAKDDLSFPFRLAEELFSSGKDYLHFYEMLIEHFRTVLMTIVSGSQSTFLSEEERKKYEYASTIYSSYACCKIIDYLSLNYDKLRQLPSSRIAIETALLYVLRAKKLIPADQLLQAIKNQDFSKMPIQEIKVEEREKGKEADLSFLPKKETKTSKIKEVPPFVEKKAVACSPSLPPAEDLAKTKIETSASIERIENNSSLSSAEDPLNTELSTSVPEEKVAKTPSLPPAEDLAKTKIETSASIERIENNSSLSSTEDLLNTELSTSVPEEKVAKTPSLPPAEDLVETRSGQIPLKESPLPLKEPYVYDTMFQFAAVELGGTVEKKKVRK